MNFNRCRPSQQPAFAVLTNDFSRANVRNAMDQVDWDDSLVQALQDRVYAQGNQYAYCYSNTDDYVSLSVS